MSNPKFCEDMRAVRDFLAQLNVGDIIVRYEWQTKSDGDGGIERGDAPSEGSDILKVLEVKVPKVIGKDTYLTPPRLVCQSFTGKKYVLLDRDHPNSDEYHGRSYAPYVGYYILKNGGLSAEKLEQVRQAHLAGVERKKAQQRQREEDRKLAAAAEAAQALQQKKNAAAASELAKKLF